MTHTISYGKEVVGGAAGDGFQVTDGESYAGIDIAHVVLEGMDGTPSLGNGDWIAALRKIQRRCKCFIHQRFYRGQPENK